jgi:hypothetical protein
VYQEYDFIAHGTCDLVDVDPYVRHKTPQDLNLNISFPFWQSVLSLHSFVPAMFLINVFLFYKNQTHFVHKCSCQHCTDKRRHKDVTSLQFNILKRHKEFFFLLIIFLSLIGT